MVCTILSGKERLTRKRRTLGCSLSACVPVAEMMRVLSLKYCVPCVLTSVRMMLSVGEGFLLSFWSSADEVGRPFLRG